MTDLPSTRPGGWDDPGAPPIPAPLRLYATDVPASWVDYNHHMTESAYLLVMGEGSDAFFRYIGIDEAYRASGRSLYTVETHLRNLREAAEGDRLELTLRVLGVDAKRVHVAHEVLLGDGSLVATGEQMLLHVDSAAGRASPLPDVLLDRLRRLAAAHAVLPVPDWVGRAMRIPTEAQAWTSS